MSVSKRFITLFPEDFSPEFQAPPSAFHSPVFAGPTDAGEVAVAGDIAWKIGKLCRKELD